MAGQYAFQMSYIFYDPMLNEVSDEKHRGRASGFSQFCSNGGMIAGLALSLLFIGEGGRLAPLIPSIIVFTILALPMMLFYKNTPCLPERKAEKHKIKFGFDWKMFWAFITTSAATPILIAFFFYTNALNTITNNYAIYAHQVLGMGDGMVSIVLMINMIAAAFGGLGIGYIGDKIGARRCLFGILWAWLLLIPVIAAASSMALFFALAVLLGLTIGAGWAISRAYISMQLEKNNLGYGFSFYAIFERFSSLVAPLVWGGILAFGGGYRMAMFAMTWFIIAGILTLKFMKQKK